jgi:hypothetical protein
MLGLWTDLFELTVVLELIRLMLLLLLLILLELFELFEDIEPAAAAELMLGSSSSG